MIYKNPLAKYSCAETGGLPKGVLMLRDFHNARALCEDGTLRDLRAMKPDDVEFIGGAWRVQNDFPHQILQFPRLRIDTKTGEYVADNRAPLELILTEPLPRIEFESFRYWTAQEVSYNCYGPFVCRNKSFVVCRVDTATGPLWSYGDTIPAARSFMAVKLFNRHHAAILAADGVKISENSR